jgi:hypothetical protein
VGSERKLECQILKHQPKCVSLAQNIFQIVTRPTLITLKSASADLGQLYQLFAHSAATCCSFAAVRFYDNCLRVFRDYSLA